MGEDQPTPLTFGTGGVGAPGHVSGLSFEKLINAHFQYVPYRGAGPAMQDLVAGHIDMTFDQPTGALPNVRSGLIKAYAVTAKARLASAPEIPTVDEAGLPGFYASIWHGLWVPKGTPKEVIAKLNAAVSMRWPTARCRSGSPISARTFQSAASKIRKRSPPGTRPRSRNGGRSSRPPTSSRNEWFTVRRRCPRESGGHSPFRQC